MGVACFNPHFYYFFLQFWFCMPSNMLKSEKNAILLSYSSERSNTRNKIGKQSQIMSFNAFPSLLYLREYKYSHKGNGDGTAWCISRMNFPNFGTALVALVALVLYSFSYR